LKPCPTIDPAHPISHVFASDRIATLQPNRGDLILLLGVLSLFLCGPLGIFAWVMANSDLRNIAAGRTQSYRIGMVKAGRILGITGTVLTPILVAIVVTFVSGLVPNAVSLERSSSLKPDLIMYSGDWVSENGGAISIHPDGRGDFRTRQTSVTGGNVKIEKDKLSIGLMGIYKTWTIKRKPHLKDGVWQMDLDGEIFTRKTAGHLVSITRQSPRKPA
jgi:hypothetical protein